MGEEHRVVIILDVQHVITLSMLFDINARHLVLLFLESCLNCAMPNLDADRGFNAVFDGSLVKV